MRISGIGCYVIDDLYYDIDFSKKKDLLEYINYGEATLCDAIVARTGKPVRDFIHDNFSEASEVKKLGGVSVIGMIGIAQLLEQTDTDVRFYANVPDSSDGDFILENIKATPLSTRYIVRKKGRAPVSYVLCDDNRDGGGTRSFLCDVSLEESLALQLDQLDSEFYASDILLFSCIQWEPVISRNFTFVLRKAREAGALTVVGTASDPRFGTGQWILGDGPQAFPYIDLLIMDASEARHYSNCTEKDAVVDYFRRSGVGAMLVTDGIKPVWGYVFSTEKFLPWNGEVPIASEIEEAKAKGELGIGDSVGCGDNFAGGVVGSLARQRLAGAEKFDLLLACLLGNVCGGLTSSIKGGAFYEKYPGEKMELCRHFLAPYQARILGEEKR